MSYVTLELGECAEMTIILLRSPSETISDKSMFRFEAALSH